ncbi:hypothetical protein CWI80_04035 [Pseudidiomarina sediminum]|uniref:HipA-like kinase domain-containing protein n=1 Tax=Pseudidiomarina sediminum TaxID=431675 RepID=A0A432ZCN1_9GAMM|nr:hypothetical protein CWI80_04035 [Pseudidiomarina sediminum]
MDEGLVRYNDEASSTLGHGELFATKYIEGLQEVTYQTLEASDGAIAASLFVFDWWIRNDDRNLSQKGGNPNLFYQPANKNFFVIDHNLAFDQSIDFNEFKANHLGRTSWEQKRNLFTRDEFERRAHLGLDKIDEIFAQLPDEWAITDDFLEEVRLLLTSIEEDAFWEGIL